MSKGIKLFAATQDKLAFQQDTFHERSTFLEFIPVFFFPYIGMFERDCVLLVDMFLSLLSISS
jgi:hypothetical protein